MNATEVAACLKYSVPLFREFSNERLQELVGNSQIKSFEAGEVLMQRGDTASYFGVVLAGTLIATVPGDGRDQQVLGRLQAGETFNELSMMTGDAVVADYIAEVRSDVLLIPVPQFQTAIVTQPAAVQHISRIIAERMQSVLTDPCKAAALRRAIDPFSLALNGKQPALILVINCGSSSLKYSFFNTANESRQAHGIVERIGIAGTRLVYQGPLGDVKRELPSGGFDEAFKAMIAELTHPETGVLSSPHELTVVAHRVVHGGEKFTEGTLITEEVLAQIEALSPLAPLHNPVNAAGIREMRRLFPTAPHVAVFDTAFHHTLPAEAYLYGLPYELYEQHRIRRYGFHGTSHHYVSLRGAQFLNQRPDRVRLISCHLGNGASLCAIDHGRSVDTSMGFTPGEGLIMGTRCGDIDAGVIAFLQRTEHLTPNQCEELLNKQSGLLGLSGVSSDMREVVTAAEAGKPRALLALKAYCYRVRKYIGAYAAAMGGVEAIIFTAGIGQGSAEVRALALQGLEFMGVVLDPQRNREARGFDHVCRISSDESKVTVLVVPTDEERMMAHEALRTLSRSHVTRALEARHQAPLLIEVSAHHVHLTQEHVEALFGPGHQLTKHADLSQPGQYACQEQLTIVGPKGRVERVRVLGPARRYTQVEIAMTEQFTLGVHPPIRESGDLADSPGCILEGTAGSVQIDQGVICAMRHIHMTPADALRYGVRDKSIVRVRIAGDRELIFGDVLVRVDPSYSLAMHIDTDEANAAHVQNGAQGYIDGIQSEG